VNATSTRPRLSVTTGAKGVVNHVGGRLLCDLADDLGLTAALSAAMAPTKKRRRGYDRGQVLVDLAVAVADGAKSITDLKVLRDQPALFGQVASQPTASRTLEATCDAALERIASARAEARKAAWAAGMDPGYYVIDVDGTLVNVHSEKEGAAPTYKRGFGFYPLIASLDATGEALAGLLRPGNAGSGTAADHVVVLDQALAQLPVDPTSTEVMVRTDAAGCSHEFVDGCRERSVIFFCGRNLTAELATVIMQIPKTRWKKTISADGTEEREVGSVAEITDMVDLSAWPQRTRMLVRREEPHPGAQLTFTDVEGHRYQVFITDHSEADICFLEAVYRGRGDASVPFGISKTPGLETSPPPASPSMPPGSRWCSWQRICSLGRRACASRASWPKPSPSGCATPCSTPPGSSCAQRDAPPCAWPRAGRGPTSSSTPSGDYRAGKSSLPDETGSRRFEVTGSDSWWRTSMFQSPRHPRTHRRSTAPPTCPPRTKQLARSPSIRMPWAFKQPKAGLLNGSG
jgi:hypothetical protein